MTFDRVLDSSMNFRTKFGTWKGLVWILGKFKGILGIHRISVLGSKDRSCHAQQLSFQPVFI